MTLFCKKHIVTKSEEVKTEWSTNLAESFKEGYDCESDVLPMMIVMIIIVYKITSPTSYVTGTQLDRTMDSMLHWILWKIIFGQLLYRESVPSTYLSNNKVIKLYRSVLRKQMHINSYSTCS
jgi:hypothetical protein